MPKIFLPKIKVVGVGGSGNNTVSRMAECRIEGVDLIAVNTDAQDLQQTRAHEKIWIGKKATGGLGAGMNPKLGRKAAEEDRQKLSGVLRGADMVFVTSGLGGGTGSGAVPIVAEIAKRQGALTIAVVTKPFFFEGAQRKVIAAKALNALQKNVDTLLIIPNDRLLELVDKDASLSHTFWICDEVLRGAVQGISDLIVRPGLINVDFADLKTIMRNSGPALFGVGKATGRGRAEIAAHAAIDSPLLNFSIEGGKAVLFNVSGGDDMSLSEVQSAAKIITEKLDPQAQVIFGAVYDDRLAKGELRITVIVTGFES